MRVSVTSFDSLALEIACKHRKRPADQLSRPIEVTPRLISSINGIADQCELLG